MELKTITIRYFKPSGKWYTDGEFQTSASNHLHHVIDGLMAAFVAHQLPGLASGKWDGTALIEWRGVPAMINFREIEELSSSMQSAAEERVSNNLFERDIESYTTKRAYEAGFFDGLIWYIDRTKLLAEVASDKTNLLMERAK